ncbi:MAG: MFS transporter [Desulfarculaceae bacterium]|nr:MFS transporter [Desulfarculaceae bacterium]
MHLIQGHRSLQALVFGLVGAAISAIYFTQPVLPQLSREFAASPPMASLSVSLVILGITLACLPFGVLADRWAVKSIIALGGGGTALCLALAALSPNLPVLLAARLGQGIFLPALTSCLAAYLARTLPPSGLRVVMGSYVAATVVGGLMGRLLSGFFLAGHWRACFWLGTFLVLALSLPPMAWLPTQGPPPAHQKNQPGYFALLRRWPTLAPYLATFGSMFVFAAVFNYIPYHLAAPPFMASTTLISLVYLSFIIGVAQSPFAGRLAGRWGAGPVLLMGAALFALALMVSRIPSLPMVVLSLVLVCAGHFTIHATSQGLLNVRLSSSQGRGNSLYVLVYYLGGWAGITAAGALWNRWAWSGVTGLGLAMLLLPVAVGLVELKNRG